MYEHLSPMTSLLEAAVADLRLVVGRRGSPATRSQRAADALAPYLTRPNLLTESQRLADEHDYRQHVLHVEPGGAFSVVSLVWLPGQGTAIHDHVTWCVVGVYEGQETEVQYDLVDRAGREVLVPASSTCSTSGSTSAFAPPGDIHEVRNSGTSTAISIHVYGADISRVGSSIRRRYYQPALSPAG